MKVKLIKGLSYTTPSGSYKKGKAVDVKDEVGAKLLKTGRFEEVKDEEVIGGEEVIAPAAENSGEENSNSGSDNNADDKELSAEAIDKLKKDELIDLAAKKGIDVSECTNNPERAEKIKGALGLVNMADLFEE